MISVKVNPHTCEHKNLVKEKVSNMVTSRHICVDCGRIFTQEELATCRELRGAVKEQNQGQPPIGLRPRWIVTELRMKEINAAMARYHEANKQVPLEWIEELRDLTTWYYAWKKGGSEL